MIPTLQGEDMSVTIKGPNLVDLIKQANRKIEIGTEDALDIVANLTQSDAKDNCPVRKGKLQKSIKIYKRRFVRQIGTNVPYAQFVHNGTYKMKSRPFLVNAFEANKQSLVKELRDMSL